MDMGSRFGRARLAVRSSALLERLATSPATLKEYLLDYGISYPAVCALHGLPLLAIAALRSREKSR